MPSAARREGGGTEAEPVGDVLVALVARAKPKLGTAAAAVDGVAARELPCRILLGGAERARGVLPRGVPLVPRGVLPCEALPVAVERAACLTERAESRLEVRAELTTASAAGVLERKRLATSAGGRAASLRVELPATVASTIAVLCLSVRRAATRFGLSRYCSLR